MGWWIFVSTVHSWNTETASDEGFSFSAHFPFFSKLRTPGPFFFFSFLFFFLHLLIFIPSFSLYTIHLIPYSPATSLLRFSSMTHPCDCPAPSVNVSDSTDLPPPYSPTPQPHANVASSSLDRHQEGGPSMPTPYIYQPQNDIRFTMPQPFLTSPLQPPQQQQYIPPQAMYHPHSSTPLYHPNTAPGLQYGSIIKPAGFHTIHIPTQPLYQPAAVHNDDDDDEVCQRRFPFGALFFVFGWMMPPLWVIGACCCASSRHPSERFWAGLNLTMALLLLFSSLFYSSLATL